MCRNTCINNLEVRVYNKKNVPVTFRRIQLSIYCEIKDTQLLAFLYIGWCIENENERFPPREIDVLRDAETCQFYYLAGHVLA